MNQIHRRALFTSIGALSAFAWAAKAAQQSGMPMMYALGGPNANRILADIITESLRKNSAGNGYMRGSPCTTPNDLFEAIKEWHPQAAPPSVSELPAFLRTLVRRNPREEGFTGEYIMSRTLCGQVGTRRPGDRLDLSGSWGRRQFRANEFAWFHPNHSFPILADDCLNVVKPEAPAARPATEQCVEVTFNAPVGSKVRWGVGTRENPLGPSRCNAQRQGDGEWRAWYGECDTCRPSLGYIQRVLGRRASVPHRYLYEVTQSRQTLRFSEEVWDKVLYICLEYPDGRQTCGVYINPGNIPGTWNKRHAVAIADNLWQEDRGNCPS